MNVLSQLMFRLDPRWESKLVIAPAQGRSAVLKRLSAEGEWHGLVDRDVWSEEEVAEQVRLLPGLTVTEGWCLENHFCDAAGIEQAYSLPEAALGWTEDLWDSWLAYGTVRFVMQRARDLFNQQWNALWPASYGQPGTTGADLATLLQWLAQCRQVGSERAGRCDLSAVRAHFSGVSRGAG